MLIFLLQWNLYYELVNCFFYHWNYIFFRFQWENVGVGVIYTVFFFDIVDLIIFIVDFKSNTLFGYKKWPNHAYCSYLLKFPDKITRKPNRTVPISSEWFENIATFLLHSVCHRILCVQWAAVFVLPLFSIHLLIYWKEIVRSAYACVQMRT